MKPEREDAAGAVADLQTDLDGLASTDDYVLRNLAQLGQIARAYHAASDQPPTQRPCLFKWRHLEVEAELDQGGFGTVYQAWDPTLRRSVALKLVPSESASELRDRLMVAEAQRMARVRHANILAVHGADRADGRAGIWCDLVDGLTLEQAIEMRGPLAPAAVISLALPLADALALIHRKAMAHGDVKPANIMVERDGTPVLLDFGAVREVLSNDVGYGSPLVMAPEQFRGQPASPATDMYSFGTVLFYALTGAVPLQAKSMAELAEFHRRGKAIDYAGVPRGWRRLIGRLLHQQADQRPTAAQVILALRRLQTARPRLLRRVAVGTVIVSLGLAAITAALAYRTATNSAERTELIKDVVVEAVEASLPTSQSGPASIEALYAKLAELIEQRLQTYPDALAEMRLVAGKGFGQLGDVERGLEIAERGHELMLQARPNSPPDLSESWSAISSLRRSAGDLNGAEYAITQALAQLATMTSEQADADRLTAYNRLAAIYGSQGDWHRNVEANQQLLRRRQALHGRDSVRAAVDYHNLAAGLQAVGDFAGAISHGKRAGELLTQAGDGQSLRMGFVLQVLAIAELKSGRFDQARSRIDSARGLLLDSLPAEHARLQSLDLIEALLELRAGDASFALARCNEVLARENLRAEEQLQALRYSGDALIELGQWQQAHEALESVLEQLTERYSHLRPYYEAAAAYAVHHSAGQSTTETIAQLDDALTTMRSAGYDRLPQYARLVGWRESLANQHGSAN